MTKYKIIFLLAFAFIVCENVFPQAKEISFDNVLRKPHKFVINKVKFRLSGFGADDTVHAFLLERHTTKWEMIDTIWSDNKFVLKDINKDGFLDIIFSPYWWNCTIYLFNPNKNIYVNTGSFSGLDYDYMHLINKQLNIYCDWGAYKSWAWHSVLYQIKDYKRIDLGVVRNEKEKIDTTNLDLTVAIAFYKIKNNDFRNTELIKKIEWKEGENMEIKDSSDFDYVTYWKTNWQNFSPLKN